MFFVWLSYLSGEVGCRKYDQSSETEGSQKKDRQEGCSIPDWWRTAQTFVASEDTLAQWVMAFFSLASVLVSGWAVILVRKSLDATDMALKEARIANGIALDVERAWLTVSEAEIRTFGSLTTENGILEGPRYTISINWINTGRSPAINVGSTLRHMHSGDPWKIPGFGLNNTQDGYGVVGPNRDFSPAPVICKENDIDFLINGQQFLFLHSRVEYNVIGTAERRYSEITARINFQTFTDKNGDTEIVLGLTPVGPQNTAT